MENVPFDKCEKDHSVHVHVAIATNNMHVSYTCTHQNSHVHTDKYLSNYQ